MKQFKAPVILLCFFMASCAAKRNEAQEYYDTVKNDLHKKTGDIQSILKTAEDAPETDLLESMKTSFAFPADLTENILNHVPVKTKLGHLNQDECIIADVERYRDKKPADYWALELISIGGEELLLDDNDSYSMVLKDSIPDISVAELQNKTAALENCKYLVVMDCMNYSYPSHVSNAYEDKFESGALLKKATIYNIATKQVVDSFHIYARSSEKVRVPAGTAGLRDNLISNFYQLLLAALFNHR